MTTPEQHRDERTQLGSATATVVRGLWADVNPEQLEQSWLDRATSAALFIRQGQTAAAGTAQPWLDEQVGPGEGEIVPETAALAAGDLTVPLIQPLLIALNRIARGWTMAASILSGAYFLEMVTRTLVADAGRIADMSGMIARPRVISYVRVVELGACARCIILAGNEYTLSEGFSRHPRCECTLAPHRPGDPVPVMPKDLYEQMTEAQQRRAFTNDGAAAIAEGADLAQVVNARRGMSTGTYYGRTVQTTSEGTTRRGLYGRQRAKFAKAAGVHFGEGTKARSRAVSPRLMPAEIYRLADGDRMHAIRLLKKNGYIV